MWVWVKDLPWPWLPRSSRSSAQLAMSVPGLRNMNLVRSCRGTCCSCPFGSDCGTFPDKRCIINYCGIIGKNFIYTVSMRVLVRCMGSVRI